MRGRLGLEERLMHDYAQQLGIPVVMASEKMMTRGLVDLDKHSLVTGSVPFILQAMRQLNIVPPEHTPYPDVLTPWLHRRVWKEPRLRNVLDALDNGRGPLFIKPAKGWKRFTGFVTDYSDDPRFNGVSKNIPVWVSEPVNFVSEWRAYVLNGVVLAIKFADHGGDRNVTLDTSEVEVAVATLIQAGQAPAGFVIDFGVTQDGLTALIEMNDGFSFGAYDGLSVDDYWNITSARWFELIQ